MYKKQTPWHITVCTCACKDMRSFIFHGSSKAAKEAHALPDFHLFRSLYFSNPEGMDLHCGPPAHLGPTQYMIFIQEVEK